MIMFKSQREMRRRRTGITLKRKSLGSRSRSIDGKFSLGWEKGQFFFLRGGNDKNEQGKKINFDGKR